VLEELAEGVAKVALEFDKVVHDETEEPVEDLQSSVNLLLNASCDELVHEHDQVLPDVFVLVLLHGALNFNSQGANFVGQVFGPLGASSEHFKQLDLDAVAAFIGESLPQIVVVGDVVDVAHIY